MVCWLHRVAIAWLLWFGVLAGLATDLRVMTFNVRYPNPEDGENRWENRKELLVKAIQARQPDLIGTQELYFEQAQYIIQMLPQYRWFGISRRGDHTDEHMGVFFLPDRLELLGSGNFWLSETPDRPGSMSWGINLLRMVTWGKFLLKPSGTVFYFLNTHLPHRPFDDRARLQCTRVILEFIQKLPVDVPVVLVGDFNEPAGGSVHALLSRHFRDTWIVADGVSGPADTFHGFAGKPQPGRIDWILFRAPWHVQETETMTFRKDNRYPSDHFPVVATFQLK